MMEKKIIASNGSEYMTVVLNGENIEFRNFGGANYTIRFDVKVLDQLVPFLSEVNFWTKVKEKPNETCN